MLMSRGNWINPRWFELDKSRGIESHELKVFMRFTVIISDYLLFIPSFLFYTHHAIPSTRKIDKVQPTFPLSYLNPTWQLIDCL